MHKFSRYNKPENAIGFWWQHLDCFHNNSRVQAESSLKDRPDGTFLVREPTVKGDQLAVSIKKGKIEHHLVSEDTLGDYLFKICPDGIPLIGQITKSIKSKDEALLKIYIQSTVTSFFKIKGVEKPDFSFLVNIGKKDAYSLALTCKQISAEANAAFESAISESNTPSI